MSPSLKRSQRLSDCGLSSSVYQRCFYDDFPNNNNNNNNNKVEFYIGDNDNAENYEWFPEEECVSGLSKLLRDNLMSHLKILFGHEVVGLARIVPSVVNQILFLAESEPYGVRGANVIVDVERPTLSRKSSVISTVSSASSGLSDDPGEPDVLNIGNVKMCTDTVTTFDLILTFKLEKNLRCSIRNWLANLVGSKQITVIESNFTLRKRRLYRSN